MWSQIVTHLEFSITLTPNRILLVSLEAFTVTEFSEVFLGRQTHQRFPTFQGLTAGFCWWSSRTKTAGGSTKPPATPWRWGQSQSLKCQNTFTSWHGCLPKKISSHSPYPQAVSATWRKGYTLHQFLIFQPHMYSGLIIKYTDTSTKWFQFEASLDDCFSTYASCIAGGKQVSHIDATRYRSDMDEVERAHTGNTHVQIDMASCSLVLLWKPQILQVMLVCMTQKQFVIQPQYLTVYLFLLECSDFVTLKTWCNKIVWMTKVFLLWSICIILKLGNFRTIVTKT